MVMTPAHVLLIRHRIEREALGRHLAHPSLGQPQQIPEARGVMMSSPLCHREDEPWEVSTHGSHFHVSCGLPRESFQSHLGHISPQLLGVLHRSTLLNPF